MNDNVIKLKGKAQTREVFLNGQWLSPVPSQRIVNHSPDGFNWGYNGSGPSQLALAVCLKMYPHNKEKAVNMYQSFKHDYIAPLEQGQDFEIEIPIEP